MLVRPKYSLRGHIKDITLVIKALELRCREQYRDLLVVHVKEARCNHLHGRNVSNIVIIKGENAKSDVINVDWIICSLPQ